MKDYIFDCFIYFQIKGSAGEFMAHNLTEDAPLTMFVPDLCRTVNLEYEKSGYIDGLPYNKYTMTDISFDNCNYFICI